MKNLLPKPGSKYTGKARLRGRHEMSAVCVMTKLAEVQEAIQRLPPQERRELIHWLTDDEPPEMLAAIDEADRSFEAEGGVAPEEVRRNLRKWITG